MYTPDVDGFLKEKKINCVSTTYPVTDRTRLDPTQSYSVWVVY